MKRVLQFVAILLLAASAASAQEFSFQPKYAAKMKRFDTSWLARAHWAAAAFDYSTTGYVIHNCASCYERDAAARIFLGRRPSDARLSLGFAAEAIGVSFIPNKKLRRITQISAIGLHLAFGMKNLRAVR